MGTHSKHWKLQNPPPAIFIGGRNKDLLGTSAVAESYGAKGPHAWGWGLGAGAELGGEGIPHWGSECLFLLEPGLKDCLSPAWLRFCSQQHSVLNGLRSIRVSIASMTVQYHDQKAS